MEIEFDPFIDNRNGTVTDVIIGLMWQKATADQKMPWEDAIAYCEAMRLGRHADWRLPSLRELFSIVEYTKYNPAINITYFPNTVSSCYWSSTIYAYGSGLTWGINFNYGHSYSLNKSNAYYVRAVREVEII